MPPETIIIIFIAVAAVLFIAVVLVSASLFKFAAKRRSEEPYNEYYEKAVANGPHPRMLPALKEGRRWYAESACESLFITSRDGLSLHASLYSHDVSPPHAVMILIHGYRSRGEYDFPVTGPMLFHMGFDLLLPELRAHGASEGDHICFGVRERYDIADWMRLLSERYGDGVKIILYGISMGAATAMMTAKLPGSQPYALIADCGYISPFEQFSYLLRKSFHLPVFPFLYAANIICRIKAGWDFNEADTRDIPPTCPVLFIHGDDDDFVPASFTLETYRSCRALRRGERASADAIDATIDATIELLITAGAGHAMSLYTEPQIYLAKLKEFLYNISNDKNHVRETENKQNGSIT